MIRKSIKFVSIILILSFLSSIAFAELPAPSQITPSDIQQAKDFLKTPEGKQLLNRPDVKDAVQDVKGGTPSSDQTGKAAPAEPAASQGMSEIETQFVLPEAKQNLQLFGYSLFRQAASTFVPSDNALVGEEYLIGPGDAFTITLWGISEGIFKVNVNRDGTIVLPKAGVIAVAGMSFGQLQEYLQSIMGKYFEGVNVAVTMDKIRSINIYIVGEVARPGSYSLSSLSSVYSALFSAGGPTKQGTLRNIQLIRNDKIIAYIDLYDFLLKGDRKQDRRIESGDTIFVPMIGPVVGVAGSVNRPGIFEIKGTPKLKDVIWLAGELTPTSDLSRIQIERLIAHEKKVVMDKNLSLYQEDKKLMGFSIQDRDFIQVFNVPVGVQNVVNLDGNVVTPGRYEWKEGMKLKDLFPSGYADLKPQPFEEYGYIIRYVPPDFHEQNVSFNLKNLLEGDQQENILLSKGDRVRIFGLGELKEKPYVEITGFVKKPGRYDYRDGMTVKDLVFQSGNVAADAYGKEIEVYRSVVKDEKVDHIRFIVDLNKVMANDPKDNMNLQNMDRVNIRKIQDWYWGKVTITGQVKFPGEYPIMKGEKLSSVLERAGGYTDKAYLFGATFTRQEVKTLQNDRLTQAMDQIETNVLRQQIQQSNIGVIQSQQAATNNYAQQLLDNLKQTKLEGRVIIKLSDLNSFKGSQYDVELKDGDTLNLPFKPSSVSIIGEVYNPAGVLYQEDKNISYYLDKVGGSTSNGDINSLYVIKADGSVLSKSAGNLDLFWSRLSPGDVMIVPPRFEKPVDGFKVVQDISKLIFELVMTIAVVKSATK
ncbi:MAG: SLBB domain-containing protein [Candidatus Saganbacteria bacterium]|nr:SLBB domain-containing protein [Candidatus Saganbacteria bacterium]